MKVKLIIAFVVASLLVGCSSNRGWQETVGPSPTFYAVDRDAFDSVEDYRFAEAKWFWSQFSESDAVFVACSIMDDLSAMVRDCNRVADQVRKVLESVGSPTSPKLIVSLDVPKISGVSIQESVDNHEKNEEIIEVNRRTGRGASTLKFEREEAQYHLTTYLPMNLTPEHQDIWEERMQGEYMMPRSFAGFSERDDLKRWTDISVLGRVGAGGSRRWDSVRVSVSYEREDGVVETCKASGREPFSLRVTHHRCEAAKDSDWYKRSY